MRFLTDQKSGIPLAFSALIAANYNDLFKIEKTMSKIVATLEEAGIAIEGLLMNADAGFDSVKLRKTCE